MLIAALIVIVFACLAGTLLWRLAIYALPLWCGGAAAWWVHGAGGGWGIALIAGVAAAAAILITGHTLLGVAQSPQLRASVGLAFAAPAAIAGYHAAHGITAAFAITGPASPIMSISAAAATGLAAWCGALRPSA
jgi:hypothetical protein